MYFRLNLKSGNRKTGPIPVSTSSPNTCPASCPLMNNGCYANAGPMRFRWMELGEGKGAQDWKSFLKDIKSLPPRQLWRYAQAGDLPGLGGQIHIRMLRDIVAANQGRAGFTYTHKSMGSTRHRAAVKEANRAGFTINLSANSLKHADRLARLKVAPVATLVPRGTPDVSYTPRRRKVVICPAQTRENVTCQKCRICAIADRDYIVGFLPHGAIHKVDAIARGEG